MKNEFETEEMKSVFSNILLRLQEETEEITPPVLVTESKQALTESSTTHSTGFPIESPEKKKKINQKTFANTTLARMQAMENQKREKLKKKTELLKEKELSALQSKPEINKMSQKLGKRDKNIMERSAKELINSKKRLEEKKKKIDQEKEALITSELTFKPEINSKAGPKRSTEEFFQYNLDWIERRARRYESKKAELDDLEVAELRSAPEIDKNSAHLVEQMGYRKPIEERLIERSEKIKQKIENKRIELMHSFKPTIEERSRKLVRKKSTGNVFKRLFNLSIDDSTANHSPNFGRNKHSKSVIGNSLVKNKSLDLTFSS